MLKLTQGQGHKVKGQGQICDFVKTCFDYISRTNEWILIKITHRVDINEMLKLTQGQGNKVKGIGHICEFVKNLC